MAWWFAAPILIWGAKKIYDIVTEDDTSTCSSVSSSTVSSAKSKRAMIRNEAVSNLILENRYKLINDSFLQVGISIINIEGDLSEACIDFSSLNKELLLLHGVISCLHDKHIFPDLDDEPVAIFSNAGDLIAKVVKKANDEYGSMAGINSYHEYEESLDPFLTKLNSIRSG